MEPAQRSFLEEHGYLVLQSVLSPAAAAELSAHFDAELARPAAVAPRPFSCAIRPLAPIIYLRLHS
jgi:hypothetical protein